MRIAILAIGFVLLAACGNGNGDGEVLAESCDFMRHVPGAAAEPTDEPEALTQADIDAAVRVAPVEVSADLRVVLEAALNFQEAIGDTEGLPPEEIAERATQAAEVTQTEEYNQAVTSLGAYLHEHCPELARGFPPPD